MIIKCNTRIEKKVIQITKEERRCALYILRWAGQRNNRGYFKNEFIEMALSKEGMNCLLIFYFMSLYGFITNSWMVNIYSRGLRKTERFYYVFEVYINVLNIVRRWKEAPPYIKKMVSLIRQSKMYNKQYRAYMLSKKERAEFVIKNMLSRCKTIPESGIYNDIIDKYDIDTILDLSYIGKNKFFNIGRKRKYKRSKAIKYFINMKKSDGRYTYKCKSKVIEKTNRIWKHNTRILADGSMLYIYIGHYQNPSRNKLGLYDNGRNMQQIFWKPKTPHVRHKNINKAKRISKGG